MHFLFGTRPYLGHLYPMVPLGRELMLRGHDVAVATAENVRAEVKAAGLGFFAAGVHPDTRLPHAAPSVARSAGYSDAVHAWKITDIVSGARADVVVREPTDIATGIAAEALGLPCVVLGRSHFISTTAWLQVLGGDLDPLRRSTGLPPDPQLRSLLGDMYLDGVPPWFYGEAPVSESYRSVDAGSYDGVSRASLRRYPPMPYAYVTLGTVYNGDIEFFRVALRAASANGLGVVIGAGSAAAAAALVPLDSDSCVVHEFVPQSQLLCGASVVLCHGGFSTVLGAIHAGVPVVCSPRGSDHEPNARRCQTLGVGTRVDRADWTVARAAEAVRRILDDPAVPERARALAEEDGRPGLGEVAQLLEELPDLLSAGEMPTERLDTVTAQAHDHRAVNRNGWQRLSRQRCASSQPLVQVHPETARAELDPRHWLTWPEITTVLCLAGGGGQQGVRFAALGCEVLVADVSSEQLRRDREAAQLHCVPIETMQLDMYDLGALGERQFDLVYQPVSSCYVPDLARLFTQIAEHVRPSGWYWSEHYEATHIQLDAACPWDGQAYRIARPLVEGAPVPWTSADGLVQITHYLHGAGAIAGGICEAGFAIRRFAAEPATGAAAPGEARHLASYLPPFLTVLAQRGGR